MAGGPGNPTCSYRPSDSTAVYLPYDPPGTSQCSSANTTLLPRLVSFILGGAGTHVLQNIEHAGYLRCTAENSSIPTSVRESILAEKLPMPSAIIHKIQFTVTPLNTCWPYSAPQTGNCTELAPTIGQSRRIRRVLTLPCELFKGSSLKR
jgi:hypothetical protein